METEPIYLRLLRGLCRVYFTVIMDELDQLTDCLGDYFPHLDYVISNDDHLLEMARSLGGRWETVARSLGFDSIDTESLSSSPFDGDVGEGKSYEMLRQWRERRGYGATYGSLARVVLCCGHVYLAQMILDLSTG